MKSKQVLDVQQMQHLQELGLKLEDTMLYWCRINDNNPRHATHFGKWILCKGHNQPTVHLEHWEYIPAYTLQDVLDALPATVLYDKHIYELDINMCNERIEYVRTSVNDVLIGLRFTQLPLIGAAYSMLCWAIENGYVETNKNE